MDPRLDELVAPTTELRSDADAALARLVVARSDFQAEIDNLEAAARAALDIRAKVKREPVRAAAVVAGAGFLVLKGPQRLVRGAKRVVFGRSKPLPAAMLPDEIERTLRSLGSDGDKVRGSLERDFAAYVRGAARDRARVRDLVLLGVARPILASGAKLAADWLLGVDEVDFTDRLAQLRTRANPSGPSGPEAATGDGTADEAPTRG